MFAFRLLIISISCRHWKNSFLECLCSWVLTCKWVHFQAYKANKIASGQGSPWNSPRLCSIWHTRARCSRRDAHGTEASGRATCHLPVTQDTGHLNEKQQHFLACVSTSLPFFPSLPFIFLLHPLSLHKLNGIYSDCTFAAIELEYGLIKYPEHLKWNSLLWRYSSRHALGQQ